MRTYRVGEQEWVGLVHAAAHCACVDDRVRLAWMTTFTKLQKRACTQLWKIVRSKNKKKFKTSNTVDLRLLRL